jgi:hypothetical protein
MPRKTLGAVVAIAMVLVAINAWIAIPVAVALQGEPNVHVVSYRRWLVSPSDIVFDVWDVSPQASMVDVDRNLFKAAEGLKDRRYRVVVLAYRGRGRYLLDGDEFKTIGETRATENPIYLIRTMPEHVSKLDGSPAFETWTGGWLGVITRQLQDLNEFNMRWFGLAAIGQDPDGPLPPQLSAPS